MKPLKRILRAANTAAFWAVFFGLVLYAQVADAQTTVRLCTQGTAVGSCVPVTASVPLPVSATFTPSGTQAVNITQVLGAAHSLTNPLFVSPATGATFPVSGTVTTSAPAAVAPVVSTAAEGSHILKASAGSLLSLTATIGATSGYLMIFNATSAPADGAVTPLFCAPVISNGTNGAISLSFAIPLSFSTGITASFSTTGCFSKTVSNTANYFAQVQ